jgi:hypothetical protein
MRITALCLLAARGATAQDGVIELDGSGTTNPRVAGVCFTP